MIATALMAFLHHLFAFTLVACVVYEFIAYRQGVTLAEARRKGIGEIMTVMPLLEVPQIGYRVGILQASSMGYPIYKKMGFKDVCKFNIYLQSKKDS